MQLTQKIAGKYKMNVWEFIKFQIIIYCTIQHINVTHPLTDTLSLLALSGKSDLKMFCTKLTQTQLSSSTRIKKKAGKEREYIYIFNSLQSARNFVNFLIKLGLIIKDKHSIEVNPDLNLTPEPYTVLTYQLVGIDTKES